jgi:anti-sigma regulatory factor (Ser/Thr protein kinase)
MRNHGGPVEFAHRIWGAEPAALGPIRREAERWLAPLNLPAEAEEDLVLAVNEAASNVIDHAYRESEDVGLIELFFWTEPGALSLKIVDHGQWRPPGPHGCGRGRGIDMMRLLVNAVLIHHDGRGTRVVLRHPLPGRARSLQVPKPAPNARET